MYSQSGVKYEGDILLHGNCRGKNSRLGVVKFGKSVREISRIKGVRDRSPNILIFGLTKSRAKTKLFPHLFLIYV